ncbi:MAG: hypothetical protein Q8N60_05910 [Candidatus Diapherotrites archaeon]|nr:hypothetical protein [Candidatus Diapherotrites archaeon]
MKPRAKIRSRDHSWGARLQKQLETGFRTETERIARQVSEVKSPLAKKMIRTEVARRKKISKGETGGTITSI